MILIVKKLIQRRQRVPPESRTPLYTRSRQDPDLDITECSKSESGHNPIPSGARNKGSVGSFGRRVRKASAMPLTIRSQKSQNSDAWGRRDTMFGMVSRSSVYEGHRVRG